MTYTEALEKLHKLYPNEMVSLRYQRSIHSDGKEGSMSPEITAYSSSRKWGITQVNFADAIASLEKPRDLEPGISEDEQEVV